MVVFAALKAKDCTGTIGNGRPVIGRPVVETPYRQSTMKARTICAVLVCFLVCAASMKRVCPEPETQPPDQMQAQCEAPEAVWVATSKAPPGNAPPPDWVAGTAALYATLDEAVATGHNEAATQHVTDPLTDQGQFTTQEVFNGLADFEKNGFITSPEEKAALPELCGDADQGGKDYGAAAQQYESQSIFSQGAVVQQNEPREGETMRKRLHKDKEEGHGMFGDLSSDESQEGCVFIACWRFGL